MKIVDAENIFSAVDSEEVEVTVEVFELWEVLEGFVKVDEVVVLWSEVEVGDEEVEGLLFVVPKEELTDAEEDGPFDDDDGADVVLFVVEEEAVVGVVDVPLDSVVIVVAVVAVVAAVDDVEADAAVADVLVEDMEAREVIVAKDSDVARDAVAVEVADDVDAVDAADDVDAIDVDGLVEQTGGGEYSIVHWQALAYAYIGTGPLIFP